MERAEKMVTIVTLPSGSGVEVCLYGHAYATVEFTGISWISKCHLAGFYGRVFESERFEHRSFEVCMAHALRRIASMLEAA